MALSGVTHGRLRLHAWWKFGTNPTWFGLVVSQKPPKISPKCPFLLVQEMLKIYNLRTANAIKMKLTRIVYLHEAFHLKKDLGVALNGSGVVAGKPLKKCQKMGFWAPFFQFSKLYQKPSYMWYFALHWIAGQNLVQIRLDLGV